MDRGQLPHVLLLQKVRRRQKAPQDLLLSATALVAQLLKHSLVVHELGEAGSQGVTTIELVVFTNLMQILI